jgi:glutamate--cysteine ligase
LAHTRFASDSDTSRGRLAARLRWLREPGNAALIRRGLRGIEKESLRVQSDGRLSHRPHPARLGAALTHPYLTTDYSESLPEFVTAALPSNWETLQLLCDLHAWAHRRLDDELLWPASMPCVLNADQDIPIADYGSSNAGLMKTVYRRGLGYRYGRAMQAIAGVHFNYSPPIAFWPALRDHEGATEPLAAFRSAYFMGLVRNYRRNAWLVTYLFGASPALCKSFRPEGHELLAELDRATWHAPFATSLRMSDLGYRNKTQGRLAISANSLDEYLAGLSAAVTTVEPRYAEIGVVVGGEYRQLNANILQIENEYYSAIRPKPSKASAERPIVALGKLGVEYVEVRTLDLNPTDPVGINQGQMRFIEALLIFCLLADSPPIDAVEQQEIDRRDLAIAREGRRPGLKVAAGGRSPRSVRSSSRASGRSRSCSMRTARGMSPRSSTRTPRFGIPRRRRRPGSCGTSSASVRPSSNMRSRSRAAIARTSSSSASARSRSDGSTISPRARSSTRPLSNARVRRASTTTCANISRARERSAARARKPRLTGSAPGWSRQRHGLPGASAGGWRRRQRFSSLESVIPLTARRGRGPNTGAL